MPISPLASPFFSTKARGLILRLRICARIKSCLSRHRRTCSRMKAIFSVLAMAPNVSCGLHGLSAGACGRASAARLERKRRGRACSHQQRQDAPFALPCQRVHTRTPRKQARRLPPRAPTHHGHFLEDVCRLADEPLLLLHGRQPPRQARALNLHKDLRAPRCGWRGRGLSTTYHAVPPPTTPRHAHLCCGRRASPCPRSPPAASL